MPGPALVLGAALLALAAAAAAATEPSLPNWSANSPFVERSTSFYEPLMRIRGVHCVVIGQCFDRNMNPCEDFFTFICESQYKSPDGSMSSYKSLVAEAQDNVISKIRAILEDNDDGNILPVETAKAFYSSCMDTEQIDAEGIEPIYLILNELKGWPITKRTAETDHIVNWQDLHSFYSKINVFPLYEISVNNDALRRTHTILLRQPKPIIKEPLLYRAKTFYKYVDYIKSVALIIANLAGSSVSEQEIAVGAKQIASFEAEISKILEVRDRIDFYHPVVLERFQNITNQLAKEKNRTINWVKIINGILHSSSKLVTNEDKIDISTFGYFPRLVLLLQRTPLRVVVNYIHWRFVHQFLPHTSNELRNLYFDMRNFMHEPLKNISRWRFCGFEPAFDPAISYMFAKKYITPRVENYVHGVLNDVKQVTIRTIRRSYLLTEYEKKQAEHKVLNMTFVLGVMESTKNLSLLYNYYRKLTITENYFNNVLTLRKFCKMKEFDVIKKKIYTSSANNNFMKITTISSIGSAYEFFENRVLIKPENLVDPLFEPDFPEFKKYGMLGFIFAYEIMHAFNDADAISRTNPTVHLYSEETKLRYWNKMDCFINQFDNYYIPDPFNWEKHVYVDGERSAMENIADSAAVKIAFQAYSERSRKLGFSSIEDDEDFFAHFASLLCRPELEEFYLSRFNLALRTLPRFRVIGSLSNTNEFARTFSCSSGTQMNPETKCNFWN